MAWLGQALCATEGSPSRHVHLDPLILEGVRGEADGSHKLRVPEGEVSVHLDQGQVKHVHFLPDVSVM